MGNFRIDSISPYKIVIKGRNGVTLVILKSEKWNAIKILPDGRIIQADLNLAISTFKKLNEMQLYTKNIVVIK
jgi:hypothetical protein